MEPLVEHSLGHRTMSPAVQSQVRRPVGRAILVVCVSALLITPWALAQEGPGPGASLADLAFIAGAWKGELGGAVIEEQWSAPEGDHMMGMFRFVKDGKVTFYEMQSIEQNEGPPVLRIKHYHPGLRGWEEKDEAVTFTLRQVEGQRAVFDEDDRSTQLIYQLSDGRLSIELVKTKAGQTTSQRFDFGPLD